jgi:hypothetical protein
MDPSERRSLQLWGQYAPNPQTQLRTGFSCGERDCSSRSIARRTCDFGQDTSASIFGLWSCRSRWRTGGVTGIFAPVVILALHAPRQTDDSSWAVLFGPPRWGLRVCGRFSTVIPKPRIPPRTRGPSQSNIFTIPGAREAFRCSKPGRAWRKELVA